VKTGLSRTLNPGASARGDTPNPYVRDYALSMNNHVDVRITWNIDRQSPADRRNRTTSEPRNRSKNPDYTRKTKKKKVDLD